MQWERALAALPPDEKELVRRPLEVHRAEELMATIVEKVTRFTPSIR